MSRENVEVVRRSLEAFEDDQDAWLQTLDPELEWYPVEDGHIPSHGFDGARGVRQRWLDTWEGHSIEVEELTGQGENVLGTIHLSGRGKGSGVDVDLRVYLHFKVRNGKIVYCYEYERREDALEAAGLSA